MNRHVPTAENPIEHCFVFGQLGIYFDGVAIRVVLLCMNKENRCKSKRK